MNADNQNAEPNTCGAYIRGGIEKKSHKTALSVPISCAKLLNQSAAKNPSNPEQP